MVKRRSMDDVLAIMGGMSAARSVPEPEPVVEAVIEPETVEADPADGMSLKEMGAAVNADIRAGLERQQRENAEHNAARARGETPPARPGVRAYRRKSETGAEEAARVSVVGAVQDRGTPAVQDGTPTAYKHDHAITRARSHVEKERIAKETRPAKVPKGYNVRPPRIEKPHQSIYADPAVFRVIRQIAAAEDVKPQDLYREALRLMLKKRGYDFDKLDSGEA